MSLVTMQVSFEEPGLRMYRSAANVLNKKSPTADKGSPLACGVGTSQRKRTIIL